MANILEGKLLATPYRFSIIVSRFNEFITRRLLDSALDCLQRHGVSEKGVDIVFCPGAYEIPQVAQKIALTGNHDAIICLGCIVQGDTPHFEYIANTVSVGINRVALETNVPIVFGVLTTDTLEQAIERAGTKAGNKGWDAAMSAIELADLSKKISSKKK